MRLPLLLGQHTGVDRIADNPVAEGKSSGIVRYRSEQLGASKAGDAIGRVDACIADELNCFKIGYGESWPDGARAFENELLVGQQSIRPVHNSSASGLGQRYRIIFRAPRTIAFLLRDRQPVRIGG